jgi:diadenosine tetraphosphate (Ap4A) HIT family hydrolase
MQHDCPFCADAIKATVFAESTHCRAIINIAPVLPGHVLVIPKKHYQQVLALPNCVYEDMMHFMRKVSRGLLRAYNAGGINWTLQEGGEAGQTIMHLHFHLIPRKHDDLDEPGDWYPRLKESQHIDSKNRPKLSVKDIKDIAQWLKDYING